MHTTKGTTTYGHRLLIGVYIATLLMTMVSAQEEPPKMKCFQCSSKDSQECLDYSKLPAKECDEATKCFTKNDNGVITRGCFTSNVECSGDNCKLCDANADTACNNHNICKKCTGDDVACSQTDASADKYNDICATSATECFVNVKDKKVERRCASDSDSCDASSSTCRKTSGAISNTGIFPSSRIHCYQCSESGCSDITTSNVKSQPCQNYDVDDQCYMLAESDTKIERGCKSDSGSKCSGSTEDSKDCYSCKTDNCNNSTYKKNQKLKCIQCSIFNSMKDRIASRNNRQARPKIVRRKFSIMPKSHASLCLPIPVYIVAVYMTMLNMPKNVERKIVPVRNAIPPMDAIRKQRKIVLLALYAVAMRKRNAGMMPTH
uniref:Putative secreted protein n=1 Tax=Haematobia irritans TaxID=7368 RepID=A0A1L8E6H3_HAEIR